MDTSEPVSTMTSFHTLYISLYNRGAVLHFSRNLIHCDSFFGHSEAVIAVILYASLSFPEFLFLSLSPGSCERFERSDGFFLTGESESFFSFFSLVGHSFAK